MKTVSSREEFLLELMDELPPLSIGVEIGVYRGDFSEMILSTLRPNLLVLIDPFKEGGKKYASEICTAYSTEDDHDFVEKRFLGNTNVVIGRNYSYNVVKWVSDKYFNFAYHDASHLYEDLKRDLNEWLPKMKDDGIICGHDYINHEDFGVIQAVDEFCAEYNYEIIILNQNGGDYALKRKA